MLLNADDFYGDYCKYLSKLFQQNRGRQLFIDTIYSSEQTDWDMITIDLKTSPHTLNTLALDGIVVSCNEDEITSPTTFNTQTLFYQLVDDTNPVAKLERV